MPATAEPSAPVTPSDLVAKAATFTLLAEPTRLAVLVVLADRPHHVTDLCATLTARSGGAPVTQPALSHHLALLRVRGLVAFTRSGQHNVYALTAYGARLVAEAVAAA